MYVIRNRVYAITEVLEWNLFDDANVHEVYFEGQFIRTSEREGVNIKVTVYMKYELNRWLF